MVTVSILCSILVTAGASDPNLAGRVIAVRGEATITHVKQSAIPIVRGEVLYPGDAIKTGPSGSLRVLLRDDSVLDLAAGTSMKLDAFAYRAKERSRVARITMFIGRLWARVSPNLGDEQNFHVSTPNAVAGVRGTSLVVDVDKGQTQVTVVNGSVQVKDSRGTAQMLGALQQSEINRAGQTVRPVAPQFIGAMRPGMAVRSAFNQTGANTRLTAYKETAPPAVPVPDPLATPPPKPGIEGGPRDGTVAPLPPLELDPTKNFARLKVQVHIKGATP